MGEVGRTFVSWALGCQGLTCRYPALGALILLATAAPASFILYPLCILGDFILTTSGGSREQLVTCKIYWGITITK